MPGALLLSIIDVKRKQLRNERVKKVYAHNWSESTQLPLTKPLAKS